MADHNEAINLISLAVEIDKCLEKFKASMLEPSKVFFATGTQSELIKSNAREALEEVKKFCLTHKSECEEFNTYVTTYAQERQQRLEEINSKLKKDEQMMDALEKKWAEHYDYIPFNKMLEMEKINQLEAASQHPDEKREIGNSGVPYESPNLPAGYNTAGESRVTNGEVTIKITTDENSLKKPTTETTLSVPSTNAYSSIRSTTDGNSLIRPPTNYNTSVRPMTNGNSSNQPSTSNNTTIMSATTNEIVSSESKPQENMMSRLTTIGKPPNTSQSSSENRSTLFARPAPVRDPSPEWARNPTVLLTPSLFKPNKN